MSLVPSASRWFLRRPVPSVVRANSPQDYTVGAPRVSTGRTITETDIVRHAGQTGDFYPHHMEAEWCKTQDFKQRIAQGTLVFSVAVGQTAGDINPEAFTHGYDRLRFVRPVFIGDTLTTRGTVTEMRDDPKRPRDGIVVERLETTNQRGETVIVADQFGRALPMGFELKRAARRAMTQDTAPSSAPWPSAAGCARVPARRGSRRPPCSTRC